MADSHQRLRETLAELRAELAQAGDLPAGVQQRLEAVIDEIDRRAGDATTPLGRTSEVHEEEHSVAYRLGEAAREFENSHPTLSGMVGSVIDTLSRMGI